MPTDAQINANRANAQKSTGPRTPAGKAATRFNALKTGIAAESEVIKDEDPASLAALAADFHLQYEPATPSGAALVDSIVHQVWLQRRLRKVEAQLFEGERKRVEGLTWKVMTSGELFGNCPSIFSRLQRRIDSTERSLHRNFAELRRQQSERRAPELDKLDPHMPALDKPELDNPLPEPAPQSAPPTEPKIGSVPHHLSTPPQVSPVTHPEPAAKPSPGARIRPIR